MSFQKGHRLNVKHGMTYSPEWYAFMQAKARCTYPKHKGWKWYGARGIKFRFDSFEEFIGHIGLRPSKKHSLDRIKNNGHYEVGNVRWATKLEQAHSQRRKPGKKREVILSLFKQKMTPTEIYWHTGYGISYIYHVLEGLL